MKHSICGLAISLAASMAFAQPAFFGGVSYETDKDDFSAWRVRAGAVDAANTTSYLGAEGLWFQLSQGAWSRDIGGAAVVARQQTADGLGWNIEAGLVGYSSYVRPVGEATWALKPWEAGRVELIGAAGLVDTQAAIEQGIGQTFLAASIEQQLMPRLSIIGLAGAQLFTDDNERAHVRARLVYDFVPDYGVTAQARWRWYHDSSDAVTAYFNPNHYQQVLGVLALRQSVGGWLVTGAAGAGRELIDGSSQPSYLVEARAEGFIGKARLSLNAAYTRSAGYVGTPGYWYSLFGATVIVPF